MKKIQLQIKTLLIVMLLFNFISQAQQFRPNTEIGLLLGASYYLGDLNTNHFNQPSPATGLIIRQNIDRRFVYKAEALYLNVRSDDQNPFNIRKQLDTTITGIHFKSHIFELSGLLEFNFLPYQPGNPLHTWTPFIYTGISLFHFNPKAENRTGEWVDLQSIGPEGVGTEGQGTNNWPSRRKYSLIQLAIPMGGGVKIAINESFNIMLEYGIRKTFTDYLDDVSTTFVGGPRNNNYDPLMGQEAQELSDPYNLHKSGEQRGDPDKKDWYSFAGITLSFKLQKASNCPPY